MLVKIDINRKAAILAGSERFGRVEVDVNPADLSPEEREALATASEDLTAFVGVVKAWPAKPVLDGTEAPLEQVTAWLGWQMACAAARREYEAEQEEKRRAARVEAEAEAERYIAWALALPTERFLAPRPPRWEMEPGLPPVTLGQGEPMCPRETEHRDLYDRVRKALAGRIEEARQLWETRQRERAEIHARKERAEQEASERRAAQVEAWVREHGDENMQGRYRLHVLPEEEVLDAIRERVYAPLVGLARYRKVRVAGIPHEDDCYEPGIECEVAPADALTADEFTAWREVEGAARGIEGEVDLKPLEHTCTCPACDAAVVRRSAKVEVRVGELTFSREYALGGSGEEVEA